MASRNKKPHLVLETPDNTESSSSSEASDNSDAEEEDMTSTDELQVSLTWPGNTKPTGKFTLTLN